MRSTEQVLKDHLDRRCSGDVEGDLQANYADDLVVLCKDGVFRGKDAIRTTARILEQNLPDASFRYDMLRIVDEFGLLSWSGTGSDGSRTCHGADSYVVRSGRIVAQTIHFEVTNSTNKS
jgi:hypothetical protein